MSARRGTRVLVVGGGVMGCASAWALARTGLSVTVLERSVPGAEASSAAAGILGAQVEAHAPGPLVELSLASRARWRGWAAALGRATGIDVEYRQHGALVLAEGRRAAAALQARTRWQRRAGLGVSHLGRARLARAEPELAPFVSAVEFPDDARVDPPRLLRALHLAARRAGVEFRTGAYVRGLELRGERVRGVRLDDGSVLAAPHVVVAAGSWTTLVGGVALGPGAVRPARGQMVELRTAAPLLRRVVFAPGCYLVPRDDGRLLVGSTLEFVGYRHDVTAGAVRDLLGAAIRALPGLAAASLHTSWSSFRPYTDDELPIIGRGAVEGLVLASGHYRNGILLAPITAEIVSALVRGKRPPLALDPFDPRRAGVGLSK